MVRRNYRQIAQSEAEKKTVYLLELYALQFETGRADSPTFRRNVENARREWEIYKSTYRWQMSDFVAERFSKMETMLNQSPIKTGETQ